MSRRGWLAVSLATALALVALSLVDGWIAQDRTLTGEGFRRVHVSFDAWSGASRPLITAGIVAATTSGVLAAAALVARTARLDGAAVATAALAVGLIGSGLVPVAQDGHASRLDLSPGPLVVVGTAAALLLAATLSVAARPSRGVAVALGVGAVLVLGAGAGARWAVLQTSEGTGEHWMDGGYTLPASDRGPALTLTIRDGAFRIGDRWSGRWESSGWTVVLADDPACPDARGTYHAHGDGPTGEDLRFVKVVDTCADGARAADLESGIWERDE